MPNQYSGATERMLPAQYGALSICLLICRSHVLWWLMIQSVSFLVWTPLDHARTASVILLGSPGTHAIARNRDLSSVVSPVRGLTGGAAGG